MSHSSSRLLQAATATIIMLLASGCGGSGIKTEYVLAETLWQQGNYEASARQFERVYQKDPKGNLGHQALFRAAMTHYLFLRKFPQAVELFTKYIEVAPEGSGVNDARMQVGEIYFNKMSQYENAIQHYRKLLKDSPKSADSPEFLFRIGRSQFFLWRFEEAIQTFQALISAAPQSHQAAEASYQIGAAHLSIAAQPKSSVSEDDEEGDEPRVDLKARYRLAIQAFENTEARYPKTHAAQEAALGVVTAFEEQGLWEDALNKLKSMGAEYPIPQVIKIRSHRIQERLAKRAQTPRR